MKQDIEPVGNWNKLVKIRDNTKSQEVKDKASRMLSQLNTAGGKEMIGTEFDNFIEEYKKLWHRESE